MFRPPPRLKSTSAEAAWHNKMRDVIMSQRPIVPRNAKTAHTTRGFVIEASAQTEESSGGGGAAVWL
jgi:hypothetical protein